MAVKVNLRCEIGELGLIVAPLKPAAAYLVQAFGLRPWGRGGWILGVGLNPQPLPGYGFRVEALWVWRFGGWGSASTLNLGVWG